jgi:predicted metal-dependent hydrolase
MRPKSPPNYLAGYSLALTEQVQNLISQGVLADRLQRKYPEAHEVRTDRALYAYVRVIKDKYLRNAEPVNKILFDGRLHVMNNALGIHSSVSRVQGVKLRTHREIRVATVFKAMPADFLRMIVVHELAHLKEFAHNKAFYQLCLNMEPNYLQLEFDLRVYLTYLQAAGSPLW